MVVCTSVSLVNGALPRWTPYPTDASVGSTFWRAIASINLEQFRIFKMHEHGARGPKQIQLLCCSTSDRVEREFAVALQRAGIPEMVGPDFGGFLPNWSEPTYLGSTWVNLMFLSPLPILEWDKATKRSPWRSGKMLPLSNGRGSKLELLADWLFTKFGNLSGMPGCFRRANETSVASDGIILHLDVKEESFVMVCI